MDYNILGLLATNLINDIMIYKLRLMNLFLYNFNLLLQLNKVILNIYHHRLRHLSMFFSNTYMLDYKMLILLLFL